MEIILLEKVENLGELGDRVEVRSGYARNYLIPYGKAKTATEENIAELERRKAELEKTAAEALVVAEARKQKVHGASLTVAVKVSEEGALFGAVGITEIIEAVRGTCGEDIQRKEVLLPQGALRELGEHSVSFKFHPSVITVVRLNIVAEE